MDERINALLTSLQHPDLKAIDLSLGRVVRALEAAGSPHLKLPPVIHLAGTNGKGSTLAMLRSIYEAAGYKVHAYTSPHLVHVRERFYCAGEYLDDEVLIERLEAVKAFTETYPLTFFEATTFLAFQLFAEVQADVVLLETGLGGQFDASNVVPNPALTILTPISMDHQSYLGDTLAKIAYEKACIMKAGSSCVSASQHADASEVLRGKAGEVGAELTLCGDDFSYEVKNGSLHLSGDDTVYPLPNLVGEHQWMNAVVAIWSVRALESILPVNEEAVKKGLAQIEWPARMQRLSEGIYAQWTAKQGAELWLDGGHNDAAAQEIARWMRSRNRPCHVICAMSNGHEPETFLAPIAPHATSMCAMEIKDEPLSHSINVMHDAMCDVANSVNANVHIAPLSIPKSLEAMLHELSKNESLDGVDILLTGSLYFAGKILSESA